MFMRAASLFDRMRRRARRSKPSLQRRRLRAEPLERRDLLAAAAGLTLGDLDGLAAAMAAPFQIVSASPAQVQASSGHSFNVAASYTTSNGDNTLTGLGLRLHYNSSLLAYGGMSGVFSTGLVSQQTPANDTADYDGDPSTDKYVLMAWADFTTSWPGVALPATLYTASFTPTAGVTPGTTTTIRFSASSTASGYSLQSQPCVVTIGGSTAAPTTPGLFDPASSTFYLRAANSSGPADYAFGFGYPGANWRVLVGDWNGDGTSGVGLYDPATSMFYLTNALSTGVAQYTFGYGAPGGGWTPLVGDWNGDGHDGVGLYDPAGSVFYLTDSLQTGFAQYVFGYGVPGGGWTPLVGDWNGNGRDGVGLYDGQSSLFYLSSALVSGTAEITFGYGAAGGGWRPMVGDWNGNGVDGVGLYDPQSSMFYLSSALASGYAEHTFGYGQPGGGWTPLVGDWNANGSEGVGLYAPTTSTFYFTDNLATGTAQYTIGFGQGNAGWQPFVGRWTGAKSAPLDANAVDQLDLAALAEAELSL